MPRLQPLSCCVLFSRLISSSSDNALSSSSCLHNTCIPMPTLHLLLSYSFFFPQSAACTSLIHSFPVIYCVCHYSLMSICFDVYARHLPRVGIWGASWERSHANFVRQLLLQNLAQREGWQAHHNGLGSLTVIHTNSLHVPFPVPVPAPTLSPTRRPAPLLVPSSSTGPTSTPTSPLTQHPRTHAQAIPGESYPLIRA